MVRAATTGVVDYTKFDLGDKWEWKRLQLLVDDMERLQFADMFKTLHKYHVALSVAPTRTVESRNEHGEIAFNHRVQYMQQVQPWMDFTPQNTTDNTIAEMIKEYEARVASGELNDGSRPRSGTPVK